MAGCVLRASGVAFPVDKFLRRSSFTPCLIWHTGEKRLTARSKRTDSGFNLMVSEALDLPSQVQETIDFLKHCRKELLRLKNTPGIDNLLLDFGILRRDVAAQFDCFPVELVRLAGTFGMALELSQYLSSGPERIK